MTFQGLVNTEVHFPPHPSPKSPWALPVPDDEVLQGVRGAATGRGVAVGHQQRKAGQVTPVQDGAHVEKGLSGQGHGGTLVGLRVGGGLEERHLHREHASPAHAELEDTAAGEGQGGDAELRAVTDGPPSLLWVLGSYVHLYPAGTLEPTTHGGCTGGSPWDPVGMPALSQRVWGGAQGSAFGTRGDGCCWSVGRILGNVSAPHLVALTFKMHSQHILKGIIDIPSWVST